MLSYSSGSPAECLDEIREIKRALPFTAAPFSDKFGSSDDCNRIPVLFQTSPPPSQSHPSPDKTAPSGNSSVPYSFCSDHRRRSGNPAARPQNNRPASHPPDAARRNPSAC